MKRWAAALRLVGLGWYIATCLVLGLVGGIWLDDQLRVTPLFTLLGLGLGLAAGFLGLYRMITALDGDRQGKGDRKS